MFLPLCGTQPCPLGPWAKLTVTFTTSSTSPAMPVPSTWTQGPEGEERERCFSTIPEIHRIITLCRWWRDFSLLLYPHWDGENLFLNVVYYSVFLQILFSLNSAAGQKLKKKKKKALAEKVICQETRFPLLHLMHSSKFQLHCFLPAFSLRKSVGEPGKILKTSNVHDYQH